MLIKELRITLPMTVEEYQVAQLYSVAEASKNETGGGEGIEVLKNEPYENVPLGPGGKYTKGQYTKKIYRLSSKVPGWIKMIAPKGSLELYEEAWNAYPYCKTVFTNPGYMKENFTIMLESYHLPDNGSTENALGLDNDKLKKRKVLPIDIAGEVLPADYKKDEDPSIYTSEKTGRGPLQPGWKDTVSPVMTCYKLITIQFKWWGLQDRAENFIQSSNRRVLLNFNRQVFCWTDKWHGLTMADIRELEEKTKHELDEQRAKGEIRGTVAVEK